MDIAIVVLLILAIGHLFYGWVLLPAMQTEAEMELLRLRDELLHGLLENTEEEERYKSAIATTERGLQLVESYDILLAIAMSKVVKKHPEVVQSINKERSFVQDGTDEQLQAFDNKMHRIMLKIGFVNSLGFIVGYFPLIVIGMVFWPISQRMKKITNWVSYWDIGGENKTQRMLRFR